MKHRILTVAAATAIGLALTPQPAPVAAAPFNDPSIPNYTQWQMKWDRAAYRNPHVLVGEVIDFRPYRVRLRRSNGVLQTVDLKHGTTILPVDSTPTPGERVALVGYYSRGTFIVNRLIIR